MTVSLKHRITVLTHQLRMEREMAGPLPGFDNWFTREPEYDDQQEEDEQSELDTVYEKLWRSNLRVGQLENALKAIAENPNIVSWLAKILARQALEEMSDETPAQS